MATQNSVFAMKRVFTIAMLVLVCTQVMFAVCVLDARHLALCHGDELKYCLIDTNDTISPGEERVWDFSSVIPGREDHLAIKRLSESSDTFTCVVGDTKYYFLQRNDSLMSVGFENNLTNIFYDNKEVLLSMPLYYNYSILGHSTGIGHYADRYSHHIHTNYATTADAYGKLITPNNDTISNVVRISTFRELHNKYIPLSNKTTAKEDSIILHQVESRLYAVGYRYPVIVSYSVWQNEKSISSKAYYFPLSSLDEISDFENEELRGKIINDSKYLSRLISHGETQQIQAEDGNDNNSYQTLRIVDYQFSQNKNERSVSVKFTTSEDADITLILANIYGVVYHTERHQAMAGETYTVDLNYGSFPYSVAYGLSILVNSERYSEKFYR